jgi:hypothetical protein
VHSTLIATALTHYVARHSDSPTTTVLISLLAFYFGIASFCRGFRLLQNRRLILDTPFSKIRSASMGMVEVSGLAVGPYTLIAPITARPCYYYRTLVWELQQRGKNKQWVKVAAECRHLPFFVDDNSGRLLVDPRGADLDLHRDFEQQFSDSFFTTEQPVPPNVVALLARYGVTANNKIKVEEFCIKPKNALFILGTLAENPGVEVTAQPVPETERLGAVTNRLLPTVSMTAFAHRSDEPTLASDPPARPMPPPNGAHPEVIRLSTPATATKSADMTQQQKVAAALLKAGISNPAAWAAAGVSPAGLGTLQVQVIADPSASPTGGNGSGSSENGSNGNGANGNSADAATHAPATLDPSAGFVLHPPVVLMKGSNNPTFMISWRSQQDVARSLGWKCTLMIWGGAALALLSLYLILNACHLI